MVVSRCAVAMTRQSSDVVAGRGGRTQLVPAGALDPRKPRQIGPQLCVLVDGGLDAGHAVLVDDLSASQAHLQELRDVPAGAAAGLRRALRPVLAVLLLQETRRSERVDLAAELGLLLLGRLVSVLEAEPPHLGDSRAAR